MEETFVNKVLKSAFIKEAAKTAISQPKARRQPLL
jgi:hypothetical protein